ncbi:hypothetical protein D3C71_1622220 [compost metagenome]
MAHRQAAQTIAHMRVGPGQVEQQVGATPLIEHAQGEFQRVEILIVRTTIGQLDIQIAQLLAKGKVPRPV